MVDPPEILPPDEAAPLCISHPKKRAMLSALSQTGNVSAAARAAGISRRTHYHWLHDDPDYPQAVENAMEEAADVLEAVARRRALVGSDTLLIFLLKAVRPAKFREYHHVTHTASPDDYAARVRRALQKMKESVPAVEATPMKEIEGP